MTSIIQKPKAPVAHAIHQLIAERWSPRAFADRAIDPETVNKLLEAARWAPSAFNEQPWRFVYAHKGGKGYADLLNVINSFNQTWASTAPLLVLAIARNEYTHNNAPNAHAKYDLGAAVANLTLQAMQEGVYVHQMAGFDAELARETFGIPTRYTPVAAIAAGYLGVADDLPEKLREREYAPQQRKKIEAFAFEGGFNDE